MSIERDNSTPESEPTQPPRSRRAVLAGAIGGVAGLIAGRLGSPAATRAAAGDPIILGSANDAGTSNTTVKTNSASPGIALQMNNLGTGTGAFMLSTGGVGLAAQTGSADKFGASVTNQGAIVGTGGAILATGKQNHGLVATTLNNTKYAVYGINNATLAPSFGVVGETNAAATGAAGVFGQDVGGTNISSGVWGVTNSSSGNGVYGLAVQSSDDNYAVYGFGTGASFGVVGESDTGRAVQAFGDAGVSGDLDVTGNVNKAGGTFKIDHPLDPANKYLLHSFVESPDMKNVYDGVVTLDGKGEATIDLPAYFDALNKDFRYQLTAIGKAAPDLHVKSEASKNMFSIAGGAAGQKVSWQVTGIRQDAYAKAHPVVVELAKAGAEKGRYLHPTENGVAKSKGLNSSPKRGKS